MYCQLCVLYLIWISFNFCTNSTPVLGFKFHFQLNLSGKLLAGALGGEWNSHVGFAAASTYHHQNHQIIEWVSDLKVDGKLYWIPHCTKALQLPSSQISRIQCIKEKSLGIFWNKISKCIFSSVRWMLTQVELKYLVRILCPGQNNINLIISKWLLFLSIVQFQHKDPTLHPTFSA